MKRRSALATAAAVAGTFVAASAAAALNTAILTSGPDDGVGSMTPVNDTIASDPDPTSLPTAPDVRATTGNSVTTSGGSSVAGVYGEGEHQDDEYEEEDGEHEDDEHEYEDGEHEDEEREYEGYEHDD